MKPKIAIVGCGAVGGYTGAHMVQAGEEVIFIDPWPQHVEHMRTHGLRITHARDVPEFTVPARALHVTDAQQLTKERPVDIAFVSLKSYDTAWATTLIAQYLAPDGYVVSLQNCMNEETIASIVGWGKTLGCIAASITVGLSEPGHIHRGSGRRGASHTVYRAGEPHGRITERAKEVARLVGHADSATATGNLWGETLSEQHLRILPGLIAEGLELIGEVGFGLAADRRHIRHLGDTGLTVAGHAEFELLSRVGSRSGGEREEQTEGDDGGAQHQEHPVQRTR